MTERSHTEGSRFSSLASAALLVGAGALAATLVGRLVGPGPGVGSSPFANLAMADMVASTGDYTAMTTRTASQELLYVVDDRAEQLLIYEVNNAREIILLRREDLPSLFAAARARSGG